MFSTHPKRFDHTANTRFGWKKNICFTLQALDGTTTFKWNMSRLMLWLHNLHLRGMALNSKNCIIMDMLIDVLFALHDTEALSRIVPSCLELNPNSAKYRILHEYIKRDQRALKHLKTKYPKQFTKCTEHLHQLRTLCDLDESERKVL